MPRDSRPASGRRSKTYAPTGARTRSGSPRWTPRSGTRSTRSGRRPLLAPSTGWSRRDIGGPGGLKPPGPSLVVRLDPFGEVALLFVLGVVLAILDPLGEVSLVPVVALLLDPFGEVALLFVLGVVLAILDPLRELPLVPLLALFGLHSSSSFDAPSVLSSRLPMNHCEHRRL